MSAFLQVAVAQAAIAISVFNLMIYLWLGLTVLLNGNRQSRVTWVGGIGLLAAALFFLCHGALVGAGVPGGPSPVDVWWRLAWAPAFIAPFLWAATGLRYADVTGAWRRMRLPVLQGVAALGILAALLTIPAWPAIASYGDFIRLLDASLRLRHATPPPAAHSPALLVLAVAFVVYVASCASLPWVSLALIQRKTPDAPRPAPLRAVDGAPRWNAADAWGRSRRGLLAASFCMLFTGAVVALIGVLTFIAARRASISPVPVDFSLLPPTARGHVPLPLVATDLFTQIALAGVGLMVGWAVVRQGILIERRLPQRGFLSHWRGTTVAAALLSLVIAGMAAIEPEGLPELLVLVALVTCAYALFTWQSYIAHDHLLTQLRPFVASLTNSHAGWLAADPLEVERSAEALFTSLCRDVLQASRGRLSITVGRQRRVLTYVAPASESVDLSSLSEMRDWILPVSDERGVVAQLELGPRLDGAGYTSADLEIARACGQRILDAVGEFAAAQVIASLARQRGMESELSAALPRRVLHDEVLPRLHLAIMRLESLRARILPAAVPAGVVEREVGSPVVHDEALPAEIERGMEETQRELGQAHRDLAALMRSAPMANLRRLEQGFGGALRAALEGEFRGSFDSVRLSLPDDARAASDTLPPIVADLLLGATLEAIRNASKHARGEELHRPLTLEVELRADERWITTVVRDDGIGVSAGGAAHDQEVASASTPSLLSTGAGAQSGLLTHGALMGLVGGALHVGSQDDAGTTVTIQAPRPAREP
ncbi:MAG TPA: ATP-binding protein [Ktedonobacterales bacterium]|jgi:anti-sigma regulatory factor (Ser/Thr protein kinase)